MRIEHEFDGSSLIKISIAFGSVFQGNYLRVDDVGDGQTVMPDRLHELAVVSKSRRLAGVERMRFRPAETEPQ